MACIGPKDTKPEMIVRKLIHSMGYRYRLHRKDLPGKPDLVFSKLNKIIFVHGCFWHRHNNCRFAYTPKTRVAFWEKKFKENVKRDMEAQALLRNGGWDVLIIWECETKTTKLLQEKIELFLNS